MTFLQEKVLLLAQFLAGKTKKEGWLRELEMPFDYIPHLVYYIHQNNQLKKTIFNPKFLKVGIYF